MTVNHVETNLLCVYSNFCKFTMSSGFKRRFTTSKRPPFTITAARHGPGKTAPLSGSLAAIYCASLRLETQAKLFFGWLAIRLAHNTKPLPEQNQVTYVLNF